MILGIGNDLLYSNRVAKIFLKYKERFVKKILSLKEIKEFSKILNLEKQTNFLTKKFSSKESFLKAVGIGIERGIKLTDINILHNNYGKPIITLENQVNNFIINYFNLKNDKYFKIHIAITDDNNIITTMVIIESL